ncbi:MAG: hypothetical protein KY461_07075 [Actinobacteria bacterium]|nr:hypothetical protein [Actinomycetota bacterium]
MTANIRTRRNPRRPQRPTFVGLLTILGLALGAVPALSDPEDPWDYEKYDCLDDRWNPFDENGERTGATPEPGTDEWALYDETHVACTDQRDSDRNQHPLPDSARSAATYGTDPYREPADHDGVRFHVEQLNITDIPPVSSAEAYRPCTTAPDDCPDLPEGLERFDGPYPVVIVMHGVIAQDIHHRFNTQTFAENGYIAIGVDGYGAGYVPGLGGPNVQRCANAGDVIDWLASPASGEWGELADLSRVALAGHSQGSGCALGYQGDPRVHAILAWDGGDAVGAENCVGDAPCQPIMFQRTDGGFSSPRSYADGYPEGRDRGQAAYEDGVARGLDVLHLTFRDTVHTDWNGRGSGLTGNRLHEQATNYYNVAWLDRHLKGRLVVDEAGEVVTQHGRSEAEERSFRQEQALSAFDRLTSKVFPAGTIDKHNISMGFWDPELAAQSGDPFFGGNVPYRIEGTWTLERLSPFYRSHCTLSVPNYRAGADGGPGSVEAAIADSGVDGDMRIGGCVPLLRTGPGQAGPSQVR